MILTFIYLFIYYFKNLCKFNKILNFKNIVYNKKNNTLFILGNGPSLTKDITEIKIKIGNSDIYAVNKFCTSDIYEHVKPCGYFFLDPIFFSKNNEIQEILKLINIKTSWKMQIFLPANNNIDNIKSLIKNNNIEIIPITFRSSTFFLKKNLLGNYFLFTGYFMPPSINVLIFAIFTGIWAKYNKIIIYGADASFHLDTTVNQKTNELVVLNKHFNENDYNSKCAKDVNEYDLCSMSEFLYMNYIHFKSHEKLYKFAKLKKVDISNNSSFSLIDAYPRREL